MTSLSLLACRTVFTYVNPFVLSWPKLLRVLVGYLVLAVLGVKLMYYRLSYFMP